MFFRTEVWIKTAAHGEAEPARLLDMLAESKNKILRQLKRHPQQHELETHEGKRECFSLYGLKEDEFPLEGSAFANFVLDGKFLEEQSARALLKAIQKAPGADWAWRDSIRRLNLMVTPKEAQAWVRDKRRKHTGTEFAFCRSVDLPM